MKPDCEINCPHPLRKYVCMLRAGWMVALAQYAMASAWYGMYEPRSVHHAVLHADPVKAVFMATALGLAALVVLADPILSWLHRPSQKFFNRWRLLPVVFLALLWCLRVAQAAAIGSPSGVFDFSYNVLACFGFLLVDAKLQNFNQKKDQHADQ